MDDHVNQTTRCYSGLLKIEDGFVFRDLKTAHFQNLAIKDKRWVRITAPHANVR